MWKKGAEKMEKTMLEKQIEQFVMESRLNYVSEEEAIAPEYAGLRMYDPPVWGYGDANDPMFEELKKKEAVGEQFLLPDAWLPDAKSVISFFIPFTDEVKKSNWTDAAEPSAQWLHARIEGQRFVIAVCNEIQRILKEEGIISVIPASDPRFESVTKPDPERGEKWQGASYTSNWSERHVAFVCGLGTFGLSKGLITEKGIVGRLGSLIVSERFEPRKREYTDIYEYCTRCGACIRRCPAGAISLENGKEHLPCDQFLEETKKKYAPRYGCGKCQTKVPCESRIPGKRG